MHRFTVCKVVNIIKILIIVINLLETDNYIGKVNIICLWYQLHQYLFFKVSRKSETPASVFLLNMFPRYYIYNNVIM